MAQPWVPFKCYQLSAGRYSGVIRAAGIGGLNLVHEYQDQTIQKIGITPPDTCMVSITLRPDAAARFCQFDLTAESAVYLLPADTEFDAVVPRGVETLYVTFDQNELLGRSRLLDERFGRDEPRALTAFNTPRRAVFISTLISMLRLLDTCREQKAIPDHYQLRRTLMDNVLLTIHHAGSFTPGNAPDLHARRRILRTVREAREYTEACLEAGRCPSIVDICAYVGVSERTLQYSFRDLLGMTPIAYLRIMRLNRARAELRHPACSATTVTETATRWGFLHLGKFSRDFGKLFHEKPSETLRQGHARSGSRFLIPPSSPSRQDIPGQIKNS